jgi:hypothetical protein
MYGKSSELRSLFTDTLNKVTQMSHTPLRPSTVRFLAGLSAQIGFLPINIELDAERKSWYHSEVQRKIVRGGSELQVLALVDCASHSRRSHPHAACELNLEILLNFSNISFALESRQSWT